MRPVPGIALAVRWPTTWLFLSAHRSGDFSSLAMRHALLAHRGLPWVLADR